MGENTTRLSLYKPAIGEENWGDTFNNNLDTLDNSADYLNDIYACNPLLAPNDNCDIVKEYYPNEIFDGIILASGTEVTYEYLNSRGILITVSGLGGNVGTDNWTHGGILYPLSQTSGDITIVTHIQVMSDRKELDATGSEVAIGPAFFNENTGELWVAGFVLTEYENVLLVAGGYSGDAIEQDYISWYLFYDSPNIRGKLIDDGNYYLSVAGSHTGELWNNEPTPNSYEDMPYMENYPTHVGIAAITVDNSGEISPIKILVKTFRVNCDPEISYTYK